MSSYSHNFAVCIGRQLGSGGRNVALAISRKMGIAFYDKEIINQAAKDSGLDPEYFEKVDEKPTVPILGGFAGMHIPFFSGGYLDTESYLGNNNLWPTGAPVSSWAAAPTTFCATVRGCCQCSSRPRWKTA